MILSRFETLAESRGYEPSARETTLQFDGNTYDPNDPLDVKKPIGLSLEEYRTLLNKLDPDATRQTWLSAGLAGHHEFNGDPEAMLIWDEWSAGGSKYKEGEPEKFWNGFGKNQGRPVTAAYLIKLTKNSTVENDPNFFKNLNWSPSRFIDNPPKVQMVVENMLPKGITSLFYSAGGAGKSTLLLQLACRVALANTMYPDMKFMGNTVNGGKAVILTAEDPEDILNERYIYTLDALAKEVETSRKALREITDKHLSIVSTFSHSVALFKASPDGHISTTPHYNMLMDCFEEMRDLKLIIIDTKSRYSPGEGLGNVAATQEITYYEAIAKKTGATVMLMHHSSKAARGGQMTGIQAYRDATALYDSVRAAWYMRGLQPEELAAQGEEETDGVTWFMLENSKNNYIPMQKDIVVRREGYSYQHHRMAPKLTATQKKSRKKDKGFHDFMEMLQGLKSSELKLSILHIKSGDFGMSRRDIDVFLKDAVAAELVIKKCEGKKVEYELTEEGRMYKLMIGEGNE